MRLSLRTPLLLAVALAMCAAGWRSAAASTAAQFVVPVGDVALDIDGSQIDEKMGGAFVLGLRSGANNCFIAALFDGPRQVGEISFVVKPPAGEGHYLVTLAKHGGLGDPLVECVRGVFGDFYHYRDKVAFDEVRGTLRFTPRLVSAPLPPTDAEIGAVLAAQYAETKVVRVEKVTLASVSLDGGSSSEIFRRSVYAVDLVFVADGYESACTHYELYKVFTARPYKTPYAGHACESTAHKAGDRTTDTTQLAYRLALWPEVGARWELRVGGITGTQPAGQP